MKIVNTLKFVLIMACLAVGFSSCRLFRSQQSVCPAYTQEVSPEQIETAIQLEENV